VTFSSELFYRKPAQLRAVQLKDTAADRIYQTWRPWLSS